MCGGGSAPFMQHHRVFSQAQGSVYLVGMVGMVDFLGSCAFVE